MRQSTWPLAALALAVMQGASVCAKANEDVTKIQNAAAPVSENTADSLYEQGRRLERGLGIPRDSVRALETYCAAARAGHGEAALAIGLMFMTGQGLGQNRPQASAWMKTAADLGNVTARRLLTNLPKPGRTKPACTGTELAEVEHAPPRTLMAMIRKLAPRYGLDPEFVVAVVATESGFRSDAESPRAARGLMQLTADTADRFGVSDRFDPSDNLHGGMRFLRHLVSVYDGDIALVLAAYNAGEGAVQRYGGIPPYPETVDYIAKVRRYYPRDRHPPGGAAQAQPPVPLPSPAGTRTAGAIVPADRQVAAQPIR